ncbi:MAG: hypothetical protein F4X44_10355 [Gammaproteobacteria bacterium]|nr:hypothetical protein [Gammaproteobacteria bacterium]MYD80999.1 hypothetical protein [Gammaproteobacteria bacterium]
MSSTPFRALSVSSVLNLIETNVKNPGYTSIFIAAVSISRNVYLYIGTTTHRSVFVRIDAAEQCLGIVLSQWIGPVTIA